MARYQGGEHVKAGFYFNLDSWALSTISGKSGGRLDGSASARYLRIPVLGMLLFAPLMGAAFAMFLPFIGIAMVAQYAATKAWAGVKHATQGTATALGPSWQPSAAHLTGSPDEKKKEGAPAAEAEAKLDTLEQEIKARAERKQ
jgi:hypothetical protein